jgi:N-acetylmuramoyl-L-alanine amidase
MNKIMLIIAFSISNLQSFCQKIVEKPIIWNEARRQLSLEYLKERHSLEQKEPTISPRMVVCHWTVIPTMEKTFEAFNSPTLPDWRPELKVSQLNVSSHYLVDRDGTIYHLLPDTLLARHVIGLNYCAIGIENVGDGDKLKLTEAQLKANELIIKNLCKKFKIEYLIGHHEYTKFVGTDLWRETDPKYRTNKTDPGEEFMLKLRENLKELHLKGAGK